MTTSNKTATTHRQPVTPLERAVFRILQANVRKNSGDDAAYGMEQLVADLRSGGCQSGILPEMIYTEDTCRFYNRHAREITKLLVRTLSDCELSSASELFGDRWDADDPFACDIVNKNLLAWFAVETIADQLQR